MGVSIEKSKEMNVVNNSKTKDSKEEEKTEPGQAVEYNRCYNCQDKVNSRKRVLVSNLGRLFFSGMKFPRTL